MADATTRIEQIVSEIRSRIAARSTPRSNQVESRSGLSRTSLSNYSAQSRQSVATLAQLDDTIAQSAIRIGECPPVPPTMRGRLGAFAIRNLARLIWWHSLAIKETLSLVARRNREAAAGYERTHQLLAEAVAECLRLSTGNDGVQGEVNHVRSRVDILDTTVGNLHRGTDRNAQVLDEIGARLDQLLKDQDRHERQKQAETLQLRTRTDDLEGAVAGLNAIAAKLDHIETSQVQTRVEVLEAAVANLHQAADRHAQMLDHVGTRVDASIQPAIDQLLRNQDRQNEELMRALTQTDQMLRLDISALMARVDELSASSKLTPEVEALKASIAALQDKASDIGHAGWKLRSELAIQQARISHLVREFRSTQPAAVPGTERAPDEGNEFALQQFYLDLENVFRGSRAEIRERQRVYLPLLQEAGAGASKRAILDLGCGRGEWLELLRDAGLEARGIDRNTAMISLCRELGLSVCEGDIFTHLASVPDDSLGALTSFHMVEHMPFEAVLRLMDEALRVLSPGGVLILETPNPGNLAVGASTFYLDPTHVRPVPSQLLRFATEARGFCDTRIWELHPYPESVRLPEDTAFGKRFNECFYGPQDYALIARKPV